MPICTRCLPRTLRGRSARRGSGRDGLQHVVRRREPPRLAVTTSVAGARLIVTARGRSRSRRSNVFAVIATRRRCGVTRTRAPSVRLRAGRRGGDCGAVLVPLVEAGQSESAAARDAVREAVAQFPPGLMHRLRVHATRCSTRTSLGGATRGAHRSAPNSRACSPSLRPATERRSTSPRRPEPSSKRRRDPIQAAFVR